ncbi:putative leader peptide [Pseudonocardia sp. NPDC046786]
MFVAVRRLHIDLQRTAGAHCAGSPAVVVPGCRRTV